MSMRPSRLTLALLLLLPLAGAGCARDATAPGTPAADAPAAPAPTRPLGLVEVTISGIGGPEMHAAATTPTPHAASAAVGAGGVSYALAGPANGGGTGDGSIELVPLSTGSFTDGTRGAGGVRYLWATFRVRNAQTDGAVYDTPRQNLTFFAASAAGTTLGGSAIASMERFDGSAADPAIAAQLLPTGAVGRAIDGTIAPRGADVLQVLTASEAAAVTAPSGVEVLPYGFVVRNATDGGRMLGASPAVGQYDGVATFAFKLPLQASPADDPFTISVLFLAEDDSETRLTQSFEEQTPAGEAAFLARAAAIGAAMRTVLPGSGYRGAPGDTRMVCTVRTAGSAVSPTAYLVHRPVASIALTDPFAGWPLWVGGSVARPLVVAALDSAGAPMPDVLVQWSVDTPTGVLAAWGADGVRRQLRLDRASGAATASACGVSSAESVRTSGFSSLAAGAAFSAALKSDGTVVAWGDNSSGQLDIPPGLTNVVQITAGDAHMLALTSDGIAYGWGTNTYGETNVGLWPGGGIAQVAAGGSHSLAVMGDGTVVRGLGDGSAPRLSVPPGLTGVVQIAAGGFHSLALEGDGTVVAWGVTGTSTPNGLTDVVQVAAGNGHSLALRGDGTVVAWGDDSRGQATVPAGLTGVVQIAAGGSHSLALKSDGTVVAWGDNSSGQLDIPAGLTGVVQVAAGGAHSLALKSDGTVVAWGDNSSGQATVPAGLIATVP